MRTPSEPEPLGDRHQEQHGREQHGLPDVALPGLAGGGSGFEHRAGPFVQPGRSFRVGIAVFGHEDRARRRGWIREGARLQPRVEGDPVLGAETPNVQIRQLFVALLVRLDPRVERGDVLKLMPRISAPTSSIDRIPPRLSTGSVASLTCAGTRRAASTSATTASGNVIRKTEPHQKCWSNRPDSSGPSAAIAHRCWTRARSTSCARARTIEP